MTTTLVIAAMRSELKAFTKRYRGPAAPVPTGVLGIGTKAAAASTTRLLAEHQPDRVLVIGIAGGIGPTTAIGDLVVPAIVLDGVTGVEHVPAPVPGYEARGTLRTADELVVEPDAVAVLVGQGVVALDMETAAVATVCEAAGVPWSVMRGISDHSDAELIDPAILTMMGPEGQPKPGATARYIARHPGRIPSLARLAKGLAASTAVSAEAAIKVLAASD